MPDNNIRFIFNPASPDEAAKTRANGVKVDPSSTEWAFVHNALYRLLGAMEGVFDVYAVGPINEVTNRVSCAPAVDGEGEDEFTITVYDEEGRVVYIKVLGRYERGRAYVVVRDLLAMEGPAARTLSAVADTHGVDARLVSVYLEEGAYGVGRVEWSVNV